MDKKPRLVSESDWAVLATDPLNSILDKLSLRDFIRFGAVCTNWCEIVSDQKSLRFKSCYKQLPMLLIPSKEKVDVKNTLESHSLYNIAEGKNFNSFVFSVPLAHEKICCGSSQGWLVFTNYNNLIVTLFNPFTGKTITFPPVTEAEAGQVLGFRYGIVKVVLSADPYLFPNDYEVLVIYDGYGLTMAHFKSGSEAWTYRADIHNRICDVNYINGQFVVVNYMGMVGMLLSVNISVDPPAIKLETTTIVWGLSDRCEKTYIVESSSGDKLLVRRMGRANLYKLYEVMSLTFKVYKLEESNDGDEAWPKWIEIDNIGDDALFLGDKNQSLCVRASDFPRCKTNVIYFTGDCVDPAFQKYCLPYDMDIYHLEDGKMEKHYFLDPSQMPKPSPGAVRILPILMPDS